MTVSVVSELNRSALLAELHKLNATQLALWLTENFNPERYRAGNADVIEIACSMLYGVSTAPRDLITEFYSRLWGTHGELPDYLPNFDYYERLTTWRPNWAKPGMRERVWAMVDETEPSVRELYRRGK